MFSKKSVFIISSALLLSCSQPLPSLFRYKDIPYDQVNFKTAQCAEQALNEMMNLILPGPAIAELDEDGKERDFFRVNYKFDDAADISGEFLVIKSEDMFGGKSSHAGQRNTPSAVAEGGKFIKYSKEQVDVMRERMIVLERVVDAKCLPGFSENIIENPL